MWARRLSSAGSSNLTPCIESSVYVSSCMMSESECGLRCYFCLFAVSGEVTCMTCFALGDVSNLMMCTNCGHHYHGSCVGLALLPGNILNCDLLMCKEAVIYAAEFGK